MILISDKKKKSGDQNHGLNHLIKIIDILLKYDSQKLNAKDKHVCCETKIVCNHSFPIMLVQFNNATPKELPDFELANDMFEQYPLMSSVRVLCIYSKVHC